MVKKVSIADVGGTDDDNNNTYIKLMEKGV
jgi:hypothetical protein